MKHRSTSRAAQLLGASFLAIAAVTGLSLSVSAAESQSIDFDGATFVNKGLVAVGRVPSDAKDKLGDTLGGIGSGMVADVNSWKKDGDTYTGTLYMLPDRGWNTEGSVDYPGRLQKFSIALTPVDPSATVPAGDGQQAQLKLTYDDSIIMHEADGTPSTGLDPTAVRPAANGFPDLPVADNHISVDDEGVVLMADGSFWVSDEYGPYVYHYTADGTLLSVIQPPQAFIPMRDGKEDFSSNNPPSGGKGPKEKDPSIGRQNNQGFEGLSMSADGKQLFVLLQSATIQDGGKAGGGSPKRFNTRFLTYDISDVKTPKLAAEYVVQLPRFKDAKGKELVAAQSEIHALDDHRFLVISRDAGHGFGLKDSTSVYRSIDLFDTAGATNIAGSKFDGTTPVAPDGVLDASVTPVKYAKFIDINDNAQLNRFGLHNGEPNDTNALYEKWESMALLPAMDQSAPDDYFLVVGSDNDFITTKGAMEGKPYNDELGKDIDTVVLVYRITLPDGMKPL
jgi:hypothetical protein